VRTTLSLDDDVARLVEQEMRRSGASFKETINGLLRLGLMAGKQSSTKRFTVSPRRLGLPPGLSYDNVSELLEAVEGTSHR
jgi:hypothetical protein